MQDEWYRKCINFLASMCGHRCEICERQCVCVCVCVRGADNVNSVVTQCIILTYWTWYSVVLLSHIIQNIPATPLQRVDKCLSTKHS